MRPLLRNVEKKSRTIPDARSPSALSPTRLRRPSKSDREFSSIAAFILSRPFRCPSNSKADARPVRKIEHASYETPVQVLWFAFSRYRRPPTSSRYGNSTMVLSSLASGDGDWQATARVRRSKAATMNLKKLVGTCA